jgi:hypothetical protein
MMKHLDAAAVDLNTIWASFLTHMKDMLLGQQTDICICEGLSTIIYSQGYLHGIGDMIVRGPLTRKAIQYAMYGQHSMIASVIPLVVFAPRPSFLPSWIK